MRKLLLLLVILSIGWGWKAEESIKIRLKDKTITTQIGDNRYEYIKVKEIVSLGDGYKQITGELSPNTLVYFFGWNAGWGKVNPNYNVVKKGRKEYLIDTKGNLVFDEGFFAIDITDEKDGIIAWSKYWEQVYWVDIENKEILELDYNANIDRSISKLVRTR